MQRQRGAQPGNKIKSRSAAVLNILMSEARRDDWDRVRRGCSAMLDLFAAGDIGAANWVMDRIGVGKAAPQVPEGFEDRSFSVTWSFGPPALEVQSNQQLTSAPALPAGEVAAPVEREG